jgi:hypothetical protein
MQARPGTRGDSFGVRFSRQESRGAPRSQGDLFASDDNANQPAVYVYPGGGMKPPNSRSMSAAKAIVVRSSRYGPMI